MLTDLRPHFRQARSADIPAMSRIRLSVTENVHEGQGLAKHWLGLAVHWLFGLGHSAIRLDTTADTRADRFYRMQGWERSR
jgi:GNAT superfamily N-acetyltransferase